MANDPVWIRATVEQMAATTEYLAVPRAEWDAMTDEQREQVVDDFGAQVMNDQGGYGAGVVDEADVPDEYREGR